MLSEVVHFLIPSNSTPANCTFFQVFHTILTVAGSDLLQIQYDLLHLLPEVKRHSPPNNSWDKPPTFFHYPKGSVSPNTGHYPSHSDMTSDEIRRQLKPYPNYFCSDECLKLDISLLVRATAATQIFQLGDPKSRFNHGYAASDPALRMAAVTRIPLSSTYTSKTFSSVVLALFAEVGYANKIRETTCRSNWLRLCLQVFLNTMLIPDRILKAELLVDSPLIEDAGVQFLFPDVMLSGPCRAPRIRLLRELHKKALLDSGDREAEESIAGILTYVTKMRVARVGTHPTAVAGACAPCSALRWIGRVQARVSSESWS